MTEERLKELEIANSIEHLSPRFVQELIDEVRFLQAALADARKEVDGNQKLDSATLAALESVQRSK